MLRERKESRLTLRFLALITGGMELPFTNIGED